MAARSGNHVFDRALILAASFDNEAAHDIESPARLCG